MKRDDASRRMVAQISDLVGAAGGKVVQEILTVEAWLCDQALIEVH